MSGWKERAERMAAQLVADGHLTDPRWREAFANTPFHLFLPGSGPGDLNDEPPVWWLDAVYADPMPGVFAWLLELLIPADGGDTMPDGRPVRVLEIGAGPGYATMLLCHRLGDKKVTAADPQTIETVRATLAHLGQYPRLLGVDGPYSAARYGPFEAVLCAGADTALSAARFQQVGAGGRIVAVVHDRHGNVGANVYQRVESGAVRCRTVTREHGDGESYVLRGAVPGRDDGWRHDFER